jgi:hypothetical protein
MRHPNLIFEVLHSPHTHPLIPPPIACLWPAAIRRRREGDVRRKNELMVVIMTWLAVRQGL